jgi:hypothetical protein
LVATNSAHPVSSDGLARGAPSDAALDTSGAGVPPSHTVTEQTGSVSHGDTRPGPDDV